MITDADREAAASFLENWEPGPEMTVVKLARAFAAHRKAAMIEGARLMQEKARYAVRACQGVDAVGWRYADGAMSQLDPATVIKEAE